MDQIVIKSDVVIKYMTRPMLEILEAVFMTWDKPGSSPCVTSSFDGRHMKNSKHYSGLALDLRTNALNTGELTKWADGMRKVLGDDYDVVVESNHLHVEYDPKPKKAVA